MTHFDKSAAQKLWEEATPTEQPSVDGPQRINCPYCGQDGSVDRLRAENERLRENYDTLEAESMVRASLLKTATDQLRVAVDAMELASRLCYPRDIDGELLHLEFSRHETYRVLKDGIARIREMGGK